MKSSINVKKQNMNNKIFLLIILTFCGGFFSCESFLDEYPSKQNNKPIETTEDLQLLLNRLYDYTSEKNYAAMCATDNAAVDTFHYAFQPKVFTNNNALGWFLWDDYIQENAIRAEDWTAEFLKIGKANLILDFVDFVEGDDAEKEEIRKEARFIRAYSYFNLATVYCLTYSEDNFNELGLPIKKSISVEEDITRASLKETFDFIEEDFVSALDATITDCTDAPWRYSLPAVQAFAARFYLYTGDYENAEKYSKLALEAHSELENFEDVMYDNGELYSYKGSDYPNARKMGSADMYLWKEMYYTRFIPQRTYYLHAYPSQKLLDSYDTLDIRYDAMMVENIVVGTAQSPYVGYYYLNYNYIPSGPTTAEMFLIQAECAARNGDISTARTNIEALRIKRYKAADYTEMNYPSDTKDLVQLVIDERNREFPFSLRWYDLHRINRDELIDDVTITREFYSMNGNIPELDQPLKTYTLEAGSRRYAMPIPLNEITASGNVLEQNKY